MSYRKIIAASFVLILTAGISLFGQDPGWPRKHTKSGNTLVIYQPQVDEWSEYTTITWRQAFELTPAGAKAVIGAASMTGTTTVNNDNRTVVIQNITVVRTSFPSLDPDASAKMDRLLKSFLPPVVNISLDRVVAYLPKPETVNSVRLNNDPPAIFVSYSPAILLSVDGEPKLAEIPKTKLKFVVNTQWPVFLDSSQSKYYLLVDQRWFVSQALQGPWTVTTKLPKDMGKLSQDSQWAALKNVIPPPAQSSGPVPKVFYSTVPSEIILFTGRPVYTRISGTQLVYATNTESPVFVDSATNDYYYLAAGRWFRSKDLSGPWSFASLDLPADFAKIPLSSPASAVLSSVPGTEEAKDAVLIAQIPTVMEIDPQSAAAKVKVTYDGGPTFAPIEGTSLAYATNTADKVIKVGDVYYLCLQGVWFMSPNPQGPWTTAASVPKEIYTIPSSSPVYNVTYVTQTTTPAGTVESSYTAGYFGVFVMGAAVGAIIANGTGYYYPPYIYHPPYGYPIYRPYPVPYGYGSFYNTANGSYGRYVTAYGPYGSATRAASYNPYTGTYKRSAAVATPYGSRSAGQAYNPYTGTYAATRQGSSPTAQWGQSYVSNGSRAAISQHYSTAQGTVGSIHGSQGGVAYGKSGVYGNAVVGRTSGGDVYAGKDGNIYKRTGSGWQQYDNGSWNSVNTPGQQQKASYQQQGAHVSTRDQQQPASTQLPQTRSPRAQPVTAQPTVNQTRSSGSVPTANLNSEMQNRQRGAAQSQRYGGTVGGFGGGGRSWGSGSSMAGHTRSSGARRRR